MPRPERFAVDRPAACPVCECTVRCSLRVLRRDEDIDDEGTFVVRRRVKCLDCGEIYTLITYHRAKRRENLAHVQESR